MSDSIEIRKPRVQVSEVEVSRPTLVNGCWHFEVRCDATMLLADLLGESVSIGIREWQKRLRGGK
jgi:hypothetical protein